MNTNNHISACPGRTDGEIPDADVVTDDAAADPAAEGEDGEVCEVRTFTFSIFRTFTFSIFSFFSVFRKLILTRLCLRSWCLTEETARTVWSLSRTNAKSATKEILNNIFGKYSISCQNKSSRAIADSIQTTTIPPWLLVGLKSKCPWFHSFKIQIANKTIWQNSKHDLSRL